MKDEYKISKIKGLKTRAINILHARGIRDIRDLQMWLKEKFVDIKHIGPTSVEAIEKHMKKLKIKWRPPINLPKNIMIQEILNVMKYRDGDFSVGQIAKSTAYAMSKADYPKGNLLEALNILSDEHVRRVYVYLLSYIDHMKRIPTISCPYCASNVREQDMPQDVFVVKFVDNYVRTIISQLGPKKAKKRLIEEGTIALRMQIEDQLGEEAK